jgi:hypothetical protein
MLRAYARFLGKRPNIINFHMPNIRPFENTLKILKKSPASLFTNSIISHSSTSQEDRVVSTLHSSILWRSAQEITAEDVQIVPP